MDFTAALLLSAALAATCGLRAFVPLLSVSVVAGVGLVELQPSWAPLGAMPMTLVLAALAMAEIALDKLPEVDRLVDMAGFVLRPIAGTLVVLALLPVDPLTAAAIGGVLAFGLGVLKAKLRVAAAESTGGSTGGVALSAFEDALVLLAVALAWLFAPLTLLGLTTLAGVAAVASGTWQRSRWARMARQSTMSQVTAVPHGVSIS